MDAAVFALQPNQSGNFLSNAGRALGCVYICIWSYLPQPANCLASTDGWFHEENQSLGRRLFDLYRKSFFNVETGHFPGLAFKEELDYLEVDEPRLTTLAGIPAQRHFYREAAIKAAVFIASREGEIEFGWSINSSIEGMRERIMRAFFQQRRILEHTSPGREYLPFPSSDNDDAALVRAFLEVLSASPSSDLIPGRRESAFRPYSISVRPTIRPGSWVHGQRTIKRVFTMMRRIEALKACERVQESSHHVISERKRRERLNESYVKLRNLLPSDSRKDRSSLLERAIESMNAMKGEIVSLQEKNRTLESHLKAPEGLPEEAEAPGEKVEIRVNRCSESSSSSSMRIELRITVPLKCNAARLLLRVLKCLKEMGNIELNSMEALGCSRHESPLGRIILNFQIEGREWDEAGFVEMVSRAVDTLDG